MSTAATTNDPMANLVSAEVQEGVMELLAVARAEGLDDSLIVSILHESASLVKERRPRGTSLTAERAKYLVDSGTYTADELATAEAEIADGALERMVRKSRLTNVGDSLSAADVAELLHLDASSVRHRQAKKLLYSFRVGSKRRYPNWQFVAGEGRLIPHLNTVVAAIPDEMQSATVRGFMTTPKDSLYMTTTSEDTSSVPRMSPVQWLEEGGDPQAVLDILETYLQS